MDDVFAEMKADRTREEIQQKNAACPCMKEGR